MASFDPPPDLMKNPKNPLVIRDLKKEYQDEHLNNTACYRAPALTPRCGSVVERKLRTVRLCRGPGDGAGRRAGGERRRSLLENRQ